jgi:hypothetical protein
VFWAIIHGVAGVSKPMRLDLIGLGPDAREALANGVHYVLDGVLPVLRHDVERGTPPEDVTSMTYTTATDGKVTVWDLLTGEPAVGGDGRDEGVARVKDNLLTQGIVDSLVDAAAIIRPHWFKFLIVHVPGKEMLGDVKVDGVPIGIAPSFESDAWPAATVFVRQFGLLRPTDRPPEERILASLRERGAEIDDQRPWWRRLSGSR